MGDDLHGHAVQTPLDQRLLRVALDAPLTAKKSAVATQPVTTAIPHDPDAYQKYVGSLVGIYVGVYTGIRSVIDPFHVGDWEAALTARHQQLFAQPVPENIQKVITDAVNRASGLDTPPYTSTYGDADAYLVAYTNAHRHAATAMQAVARAYGTNGVDTLTDVSFRQALPVIATALDHTVTGSGVSQPARGDTEPV